MCFPSATKPKKKKKNLTRLWASLLLRYKLPTTAVPGFNSWVMLDLTISHFHGNVLNCLPPMLSRLALSYLPALLFLQAQNKCTTFSNLRVWGVFFCILEIVSSSSPELSFYKASTSLSQATYLLHRNWALMASFQYRKCLRKWT